ncbi:hypothetical protein CL619_03565 [archaeon]|nr:hypothetical protein [archaeon]|tara:strand:- start:1213 stop:1761 length:549 start_codon:yes stop_codon:yes gene_type:complete
MDTCKENWTGTTITIFEYLSNHVNKKFNQRKLAKSLSVSPTSIANSLPTLEKQQFITINRNKEMNLNLIEFNRNNQRAIWQKRAINLKYLYNSGIVETLKEKYPGTTIILFGSFAKGEDTYKSDIDIAIVGAKRKKNISLNIFETQMDKSININCYKEWKSIHKSLKENLCNGIILSGGIEL